MITKIIIYPASDGTCAVIYPAAHMFNVNSQDRIRLDARQELSLLSTDDQVIEWIKNKNTPIGVTSFVVDSTVVPNNRHFRNAWTTDGVNIVIDRPKAEKIHMGRLKYLRNEQLKSK